MLKFEENPKSLIKKKQKKRFAHAKEDAYAIDVEAELLTRCNQDYVCSTSKIASDYGSLFFFHSLSGPPA